MSRLQISRRSLRPQCEALENRNLLSALNPLSPSQFSQVLPLFARNFSSIAKSLATDGASGSPIVQAIDSYLRIPSLMDVIAAVENAPGVPSLKSIDRTIESLPANLTSPRLFGLVSPGLFQHYAPLHPAATADSSNTLDPLSPVLSVLLGFSAANVPAQPPSFSSGVRMTELATPARANLAVPMRHGETMLDHLRQSLESNAIRSNAFGEEEIGFGSVIGHDHFSQTASSRLNAFAPITRADRADATDDRELLAIAEIKTEAPLNSLNQAKPQQWIQQSPSTAERSTRSAEHSTSRLADRSVEPPIATATGGLTVDFEQGKGERTISKIWLATIVSASTLLLNRLDQVARRRFSRRNLTTAAANQPQNGDPVVPVASHPDSYLNTTRAQADRVTATVTTIEFLCQKRLLDSVLDSRRSLMSSYRQLVLRQRELTRKNTELAALAATDPLTGMKNRRHLHEAIDAALRFAAREGLPTSVIMLDVDHFKSYNDNFGHAAGDKALRSLAMLLEEGTRPFDVVARYGGEEFVLLLPGTNALAARKLADRIRMLVVRHAWPHRSVTASFGIATTEPGNAELSELLQQADSALYRAKDQGRDRVVHHDELLTVAPNVRSRSSPNFESDELESERSIRATLFSRS